MTVTISRLSTALLFATVCASAQAEYRCDPAPTSVDRRACEAAAQSPTDLRRFIQRMNWTLLNLQFSDYVDTRTVQAWDAKSRYAAQKDAVEDTLKVASIERH